MLSVKYALVCLCLLPGVLSTEEQEPKAKAKPSQAEVWGYGILFVTIISLASVVGVAVFPVMSKSFYPRLMTALIGLAVGSLASSSVFHLIPEAFSLGEARGKDGEELFPHHNYLNIALTILGGIYLFFVVERLLKIVMDARARSKNETIGVPGHSHSVETIITSTSQPDLPYTFNMDKAQPEKKRIATVAWMIIFGDGIHNFIDGLAIGAAMSTSVLSGISVSLAVFCEELPHELGDFAVLLNSGMTVKQAVIYNFLSACTCYIGLVIGIVLGELEGASIYIFAVAGGMFLYISLVDMVPELNQAVEAESRVSAKRALFTFFLQNVGIIIGVFTLYVLAIYADDISFGDEK